MCPPSPVTSQFYGNMGGIEGVDESTPGPDHRLVRRDGASWGQSLA